MSLSHLAAPRAAGAALALLLLLAAAIAGASRAGGGDRAGRGMTTPGGEPVVIGHRGSAGYRPEHTLASYTLAARMGADFIEPDLVSTKDHKLVARHEPEISATTDVADHPEFAARRTTKVIDGVAIDRAGSPTDFTLAELRTLRAKERIPAVRQRNTLYDGRYPIPTFQEVIDLARRAVARAAPDDRHLPRDQAPDVVPRRRACRSRGRSCRRCGPTASTRARGRRSSCSPSRPANLRLLRQRVRVPLVLLYGAAPTKPYDVTAAGGTTTYGDLATAAGPALRGRLRGRGRPVEGVRHPARRRRALAAAHALRRTTPTPRGSSCTPTRSATRTSSCRLEARRGTDPNAYGDAFAEYDAFYARGRRRRLRRQPRHGRRGARRAVRLSRRRGRGRPSGAPVPGGASTDPVNSAASASM